MARRFSAGAHERRIARRLEARGLPGLGEALTRLNGVVIADRWRIDSLYSVGAEGAVYAATDLVEPRAPARVVKVCLLPYHRPAELSSSLLRSRRSALRDEARHLLRCASPSMPTSFGYHEFDNPLMDPKRGGAFEERDSALVMERLPGFDADLWLSRVHRSDLPKTLLRRHLDCVTIVLLEALRQVQDRGYFYADLRPGNLRIIGHPVRRVRLFDAGSLVQIGDDSGRFPHVPHYLPPDLFELRYMRGEKIVPSASIMAVMAGRTLHEIATGRVPLPGRQVDSADLDDAAVSPLVGDVIDGLATGSFFSVAHALRYLSRTAARTSVVLDEMAPPSVTPAANGAEPADAFAPASHRAGAGAGTATAVAEAPPRTATAPGTGRREAVLVVPAPEGPKGPPRVRRRNPVQRVADFVVSIQRKLFVWWSVRILGRGRS